MRKTICIIIAMAGVAVLTAPTASARSFEQAVGSTQEDLERVLQQFEELNDTITEERLPLSRRLNEVEDEVMVKRREFERMQRVRDNRQVDLNQIRDEVQAREDENSYLSSLLTEYIRSFETRLHISEVQHYNELIEEARLAADDAGMSGRERFAAQLAVVQASLDRLERLIGGHIFEGEALVGEGVAERGRFALMGPVSIFASEQSEHAGLAEVRIGSPQPTVIDVGRGWTTGIRDLAIAGDGSIPFDATMGNALKIAETRETLWEHIQAGGVVMIPILTLAFAAIAIALFKWFELTGVQRAGPSDLQNILEMIRKGDIKQAHERAKKIKGPVGELLTVAINNADEDKELLEEILYEKMLNTQPRLERFMPFIALTAATSPLLGLLGTVTGMINTFKLITIFGTGDARTLSGGISEALITTEFGLIIAIPSLLVHALLARKAKGVLSSMEQTAVGFINGITNHRNNNL